MLKETFIKNKKRKDDMKKNLILIFTVLFLTSFVLGCNTMRGAGKDVENAGKSVQETVDHND